MLDRHADADVGVLVGLDIGSVILGADIIAPAVAGRADGSLGQIIAELRGIIAVHIDGIQHADDLLQLGEVVSIDGNGVVRRLGGRCDLLRQQAAAGQKRRNQQRRGCE